MAPLKLSSYFERDTWSSWSRLLQKLESPAFRKVFYPHHIDDYNEVIKRVEEQRHISVRKAIFQESTTTEERQMWQENSDNSVYSPCLAILFNIVRQIRKSDELLKALFQEIETMEEKRVHIMHARMLLSLQETSKKEEEETQKKKLAQEKRRLTLEKNKTQMPVRRSRRIANKTKA